MTNYIKIWLPCPKNSDIIDVSVLGLRKIILSRKKLSYISGYFGLKSLNNKRQISIQCPYSIMLNIRLYPRSITFVLYIIEYPHSSLSKIMS